jgi:DNA-binding transcriptional MerR regulator
MNDENLYFKSKLAIAKALGVHRHTIDLWVQKTWFPKQTKDGYLKEDVLKAVDEYQTQKDGAQDTYADGSKEEKTALECKRLKIMIEKEKEALEQARESTRQMIEDGRIRTKRLVAAKDVENSMIDLLSTLRSTIETWSKSAQADHPDFHHVFDRAVNLYLEAIRSLSE